MEIQFDFRDFERFANRWEGGARQLPFALAGALNDAVFKARQVLVEVTWPRARHVYNARFVSASLRVEKATKANLVAAVVDTLNRGIIQRHAKGGVKRPSKSESSRHSSAG
jgi:hypothetical protein